MRSKPGGQPHTHLDRFLAETATDSALRRALWCGIGPPTTAAPTWRNLAELEFAAMAM